MGTTTTEASIAWDEEAVAGFAAGSDDILVLPRRPLTALDSEIQTSRVHEYWSMISPDTAAREVRFGLGEIRIRSSKLASDIASLATAFLDQFHLQQAKLRIEVTRSQSCPKFHSDNVHVRLVTTYFGPTTEYQHAGECATLTAPLYGLVFLKGHQHSTHRDTVHHRSPEVPLGEKRLCVAIDY